MKKIYLLLLLLIVFLGGCQKEEYYTVVSTSRDFYNNSEEQENEELTKEGNTLVNKERDKDKVYMYYNENSVLTVYESSSEISVNKEKSYYDYYFESQESDENSFLELKIYQDDAHLNEENISSGKYYRDDEELEVIFEEVPYSLTNIDSNDF